MLIFLFAVYWIFKWKIENSDASRSALSSLISIEETEPQVTLLDNSQTVVEPFSCSECNAAFSGPAQLKMHRESHHQIESNETHNITEVELLLEDDSIFRKKTLITCELCPLAFTSNSKLNDHMLKHTGESKLTIYDLLK